MANRLLVEPYTCLVEVQMARLAYVILFYIEMSPRLRESFGLVGDLK